MSRTHVAAARPEPDFHFGSGEFGALLKGLDWERTSLGPPDLWPHSLQTALRLMLASRQPSWIALGPERVLLYNDACAMLLGSRHPDSLGHRCEDVWGRAWGILGARVDMAFDSGAGSYEEDVCLLIDMDGFPREVSWNLACTPVPDDLGAVSM